MAKATKKIANSDLAEQIAGVVLNGQPSPSVSESTPNHIKHYRNEQISIIRQSCLKTAAGFLSETVKEYKSISELEKRMFILAEKMEKWVTR